VGIMVKKLSNRDQFDNVRDISECEDINRQYELIKGERMVNPQLDSGFIQISNGVFDNLARYRLNGQALSFIIYIIGSTWGYKEYAKNKEIKTPIFTMGQTEIARRLNMSKDQLLRAIEESVDANIILIKRCHGVKIKQGVYKSNYYMFNKNYDTWKDNSIVGNSVTSNSIISNSITNTTITNGDANDEEGE
jgi:hypothetical protein